MVRVRERAEETEAFEGSQRFSGEKGSCARFREQ